MIRCVKTEFRTSKYNLNRLFECNRISATVWNDCLTIAKEFALNNDGKWINKSQLQLAIKSKYRLHSQSIQAVCHKYLFSRDSAHKSKKKGLFSRYPYKQKKNFNTKWAITGIKVLDVNKLQLSMGIHNGKIVNPIIVKTSNPLPKNIKEVELIYDRKLMLSISYDDEVSPTENLGKNIASVDLGEIHSMACVASNGEALVISGRKMRSIHQFRNKKLADLQRKMSKCKKGSHQWKKYNKAKIYILSKSENQLKDILHKTSKSFVDWCVENQVSKVVIGDVEGVQRNTKKRIKRKVTQKLSNWNFGKLLQYLQYKQEIKSIALVKQDESYTTQQCPCCGRRKKTSTRNYKCYCGYAEHRDVHSAKNIMSKRLYKDIRQLEFDVKIIKYLRIA